MSLLKRWRERDRDSGSHPIVKGNQHRELTHPGDFRKHIDQAFDRVWRELDRDPWAALSRLPEQLGGAMDWPAVDLAEDENVITVRVDVPGLDERDLEVEVSGNLLMIRGSREDDWNGKKHGVRRRERVSGSFARVITLPSYADTRKLEAKYEKGTLAITVPRIPGQGPRRVTVTGG